MFVCLFPSLVSWESAFLNLGLREIHLTLNVRLRKTFIKFLESLLL